MEDWEEYKALRNFKGRVINRALRTGFRNWVRKASQGPRGLWKLSKYARNRNAAAASAVIPPLEATDGTIAVSENEKWRCFARSSFQNPPKLISLTFGAHGPRTAAQILSLPI